MRQPGNLLVFNNLPSSYRTRPFTDLVERWKDRTGGRAEVLYQARRDPFRRQEWFYTPDTEIPYPHRFLSDHTVRFRGRVTYRPNLGTTDLRRLRPTHLLIPGWDAPASVAAAVYARVTGARMLSWVESNPTTSQMTTGSANRYRRLFLGSASGALVPTTASGRYVEHLAGRPLPTLRLPNPVHLDRLDEPQGPEGPGRLVFVGDLSHRKGYDVFSEAAVLAAVHGWTAHAFGNDTEGLHDPSSGVTVTSGLDLPEIARRLDPGRDVWVIPSRWDPAPLTFSEAMSLGLRVVLSDGVAYGADEKTSGVEVFASEDSDRLVDAAERVRKGPRPSTASSLRFTSEHWSQQITEFLIAL